MIKVESDKKLVDAMIQNKLKNIEKSHETMNLLMNGDKESISKLKKAANQNFLPSAYVPKDFNGGSFNMINGWSSYNKARKDNARIFLGSAANKGALYYKKLPMQRVPFEESGTKMETASDLKDNVTTSILGEC